LTSSRAEIDTRADTICAGKASHVIEYTDQVCDVSPFTSEYEPMRNIPLAKMATAYDHPYDHETYILVTAQSLYFGDKLENTLLCPNQMRSHGIEVDDVPRHLSIDGKSSHSIYIPAEDVHLPLLLHGCILYLPTRYPTDYELENCKWLILSSDAIWNPYSDDFAYEEGKFERLNPRMIGSVQSCYQFDEAILLKYQTIGAQTSIDCHSKITPEQLARQWCIGLQTAAKTLMSTTQKGVRNAIHPIHRHFRTRQTQLHYPQLSSKFYSDTMFAFTTSICHFTCGQIFINDLNFSRIIPMKWKANAGDALMYMIQDIGIPFEMHIGGAKDENLG
jgi:hypothetical protein